MSIDIEKFTTEELTTDKLDELIRSRRSFQIVTIADMNAVVSKIEGRIEKAALSCRIYTEYRSTAVAGSFFGPTAIAGLAAGAAIGMHRLFTWNPDYEMAKNLVKSTLTVTYKKS